MSSVGSVSRSMDLSEGARQELAEMMQSSRASITASERPGLLRVGGVIGGERITPENIDRLEALVDREQVGEDTVRRHSLQREIEESSLRRAEASMASELPGVGNQSFNLNLDSSSLGGFVITNPSVMGTGGQVLWGGGGYDRFGQSIQPGSPGQLEAAEGLYEQLRRQPYRDPYAGIPLQQSPPTSSQHSPFMADSNHDNAAEEQVRVALQTLLNYLPRAFRSSAAPVVDVAAATAPLRQEVQALRQELQQARAQVEQVRAQYEEVLYRFETEQLAAQGAV